MKKFTEFLEKNCQWLAIGLGAAYLLWMVYVNLLTSGTWQVPVGTETKSPGEVDASVAQIAEQLKDKMDHGPIVKITVPDFAKTAIDLSPKKMPEYAIAWANSPTADVPIPPTPGVTPANPPTNGIANTLTPANTNKVVELPKPPAPTDLAYAMGIANAIVPPPPDPNNPGQTPVLPTTGTDVPWVTWAYKISMADLAKEFQRTNIPPNPPQQQAFTTSFLVVELVRQEMMTDGSWGPQTVCPKLTTVVRPDFPTEKSNRQELQAYVNWASQNIIDVLQPPFYQVVKGDPWTLPKSYVGSGVVGSNGAPVILGPNDVREGFDPTTFVNADPKQAAQQIAQMNPPLTMKEKQLIAGAKAKAAAQKAADAAKSRAPTGGNRPGGGGPGGAGGGGYRGPGGGRGGATDYAPDDTYRPAGAPPYMRRPADGEIPDMANPGYNSAQPSNYSQMFPLPPGDFDPRAVVTGNAANPGQPGAPNMSTLVGWVHDSNCQPGHVYRYMIRYKIKNPVWLTGNVTKDKAMSDQFAITSVETAWSDAIRVPSVVDFYFASGGGLGRAAARVDVYRTQDGEKHKQQFNVTPGDVIGQTTNGVDYSTGFTLVDLRPEPKGDRFIAWLLTPEGNLMKRDVKADSENPQHKELEQQISSAAAAAAAAGGAPAMINPTQ